MSDTDGTFNFLISMIYTQMFNFLCEKADDVYGGRLPVHEEETVARIGNDDIRKDSMGVFTAVAEYAHDAEILFLLSDLHFVVYNENIVHKRTILIK